MDKSWMSARKWSKEYVEGVFSFMKFVELNLGNECKIRCPCVDCLNTKFDSQSTVIDHLFIRGIEATYTTWIYHGETKTNVFPIHGNTNVLHNNDSHGLENEEEDEDGLSELLGELEKSGQNQFSNSSGTCEYLDKLMRESKQELYPGCEKFSTLSFLVRLLHLKVYNKWSNKSFNMLLELFKEALPSGETLPKSHYDAKNVLRELGLGYVSIHAYKYDCALFYDDYVSYDYCPVCGTSRWKVDDGKGKKVPHKVLRYFPLKPRLQRLFMSSKTARDMRWHKDKRNDDGNSIRHPADGMAWKEFDNEFPWFAEDARNVRLGLATDGFNPFGNMSNSYSMWPVILFPYNFPPWICMKESTFFLSLLIPGEKSPGKDFDVYMQPLVNELKELWVKGVQTYDAFSGQLFEMHAAVLWTVNDFPAYDSMSGWSTKGYMACPVCNYQTCSCRLTSKLAYMGHRKYLPINHRWRRSKKFNGKVEYGLAPKELSGEDLVRQLSSITNSTPGKHPQNRKRKRNPEMLNWTKRSILFELPYWHKVKLRHNLDVMHIEKNICDNIVGTLLNLDGKTKDTIKARLDLQNMNIRKELHLQKRTDGSYLMPYACYTLSKDEKRRFLEFLRGVKFPDSFAANISKCVNVDEGKITGLKSHDCHVLIQRLLPIAIRGCLHKDVSTPLMELGDFFRRFCAKNLHVEEVKKLLQDIVLILCKLEMIFPPAFFDIMIHLAVHLPHEILLGGPVQFRWMYSTERFLKSLKDFVQNKARPEGSIAEAYIVKECLTFCSMYLHGIETRFNREERNSDIPLNGGLSVFSFKCRPLGASKYGELAIEELKKAHWYVLNNCEEVHPFFEKHKQELQRESPLLLNQTQEILFPSWFKTHMINLRNQLASEASEDLFALACGPHFCVRKYTGCIVNGIRFHNKDRDSRRRSQNSGVAVEGVHESEDIEFYGVLNDIIVLEYFKGKQVILFKCDWFDLSKKRSSIQFDGNVTSINRSRTWYKSDPFVLASQAKQVFYVDDMKLGKNWRVVQHFQHRHLFYVDEIVRDANEANEPRAIMDEIYQESESLENVAPIIVEDPNLSTLDKVDVEENVVEATTIHASNEIETNGDFICGISDDEDDTLADYYSNEEDNLTVECDSD